MKVSTDTLIAALLDPRLYLSGDEDGGVSLHCRDHHDGGRPLAYYYEHAASTHPDAAVAHVVTIPGLWAQAADHLATHHGET